MSDSEFNTRGTIEKTFKNGKVDEFVVPKIDDSILCPVLAYQLCVDGSKSIDIDLSKKYLFRTLDASKSMATEDPVSSTVEPNTSRNLVT